MTPPKCTPGSLEEKLTLSPATALPNASVTVAVAVLVDDPFATIDDGASPTTTLVNPVRPPTATPAALST